MRHGTILNASMSSHRLLMKASLSRSCKDTSIIFGVKNPQRINVRPQRSKRTVFPPYGGGSVDADGVLKNKQQHAETGPANGGESWRIHDHTMHEASM